MSRTRDRVRSRSSNSSAEVVVGSFALESPYLNSKVPSRGSTGWVAPLADSQRELVPARVHHPDSTVRLAHRVGTQADQPLGLRAPIRHHEVEPLAPAAVVGRTGADVPGDLRAAGRRLDSRLDAPIPHERPAEDVPPEVARFGGPSQVTSPR